MKIPSTPPSGERFTILRRLGAGSMGVVYEAHDRERDEIVALKTLPQPEASPLWLFKREFRVLADTQHRNLVALHELVVEGGVCFFTMERVLGTGFLEHVRPGAAAAVAGETVHGPDADVDTGELLATADALVDVSDAAGRGPLDGSAATGVGLDVTVAPGVAPGSDRSADRSRPGLGGVDLTGGAADVGPGGAASPVDIGRLRAALGQLADGVAALHRAGIVHRDLKPGNVLVADDGRVVILDFGLATELTRPGAHVGTDDGLTGTAAYMAPEQAGHAGGAAASDWYAVGVMLYEALAGQRPFTGTLLQVLLAKRSRDPPPLAMLAPHAPPDLVALCDRLMQRDPADRPDDGEVLRLLGRAAPVSGPHEASVPLVGRAAHLQALRDAFAATARGQAVAVYVHGPSGAGKSALVRGFLAELAAADPRPVILSGRCHVRESVPFKALDPIVDSLSRHLVALPEDEARVLLPRDLWALARVFPVMQTVVDALHGSGSAVTVLDPVDLRRRAFAALRDLLGRLADRRRVVVAIDDLQWADPDSSALLEGLLRPPDAPALLLLASFRSEALDHQPFLRDLLAAAVTPARRALAVGPLGEAETRHLVLDLLGERAPAVVQRVVRESAGSPFLVEQLARHVSQETGSAAAGVTLGEMLDAQIRHQPPGARPLLDLLAVAAHPLRPTLAFAAAGLQGDERPLIKQLRTARLLRLGAGSEQVELYHDRIRETLAARVRPDARVAIHRALADALAAAGADPELLYVHYHASGQAARAMAAAIAAGRKAAAALAFDQAAQFYGHALAPGPDAPDERADLEQALGDALASAGRCRPASAAYLRAAVFHAGARALDLRRLAAEQLLVSGHVDEGRAVLQGVLAQVGLRLAPTPRRALLSLLQRRLQLRLRGLRYTLRPAAEVDPALLARIDICSVVSQGLGMNDNIRAADFQALGTLLALDAGEPVRLARALGMEACFVATRGNSARARATRLAQSALDLARQVGQPAAVAQGLLNAGTVAYLAGADWRRAADLCREGEATFAEHVPGSTWARTTTRRFWLVALVYLGELAELRRRLDEFLVDAQDRGNLYALTDLRTRMNIAWLAADDPVEAHRQIDVAMRSWTVDGYHIQHFNALMARVQADLYAGAPAIAQRRIATQWPALSASMLPRIQLVRGEMRGFRARAALAAIAPGQAPTRATLRAIAGDIATLEAERTPWLAALARLLRAGLAHVGGQRQLAVTTLRAAVAELRAADMGLHAAAAQRQLGLLLGGDEGARLRAEAEAWMAAQTVRAPDGIARVLAPSLE